VLAQSHGELNGDGCPTDDGALPLQVQLPPELKDFFSENGYTYAEHRTNARLRVRGESVLTSLYVPPFAKRSATSLRVLVKDMSRSGIALLAPYQLWPTERFGVELCERWIEAEVVRCRKLGERCFEVGARIHSVATLSDS
jgi:hypothetical protein